VSSAASRCHSLSSFQLVEQASYTACSSLNNTLSSFENVIGWLQFCSPPYTRFPLLAKHLPGTPHAIYSTHQHCCSDGINGLDDNKMLCNHDHAAQTAVAKMQTHAAKQSMTETGKHNTQGQVCNTTVWSQTSENLSECNMHAKVYMW
jgi:hypothetical protein